MRLIGSTGTESVATAYVAEVRDGKCIEFVESIQPPLPRSEKWVLIVSTMIGCPVGCMMCDAGGHFMGNLLELIYLGQKKFKVPRHHI